MNKTEQHLAFLDGVRGIAILAVYLVHALGVAFHMHQLPWSGWVRSFHVDPAFLVFSPLSLGWVGVSIFFVVSGFCIQLSWARSRDKGVGVFYTKRFFRTYPPYLLVLVLLCGYETFRNFNGLGSLGQLGSHVLLLHNLRGGTYYGINPAFWSIAVEFQLYLIYPLLLWLVRKGGWETALWVSGLLEIGLRLSAMVWDLTHATEIPRIVSGSPFFFWFSWTIGAALADAFLNGRRTAFSKIPVWVFPALFLASALFRPLDQFGFTFGSLSTAVFMDRLLARREPAGNPGRVSRYVSHVGVVSYSIYLIHLPLMAALPVLLKTPGAPLPPLVSLAVCLFAFPLIVMLSDWMYRLVELPSIEMGKQILKLQSAARPAHAVR